MERSEGEREVSEESYGLQMPPEQMLDSRARPQNSWWSGLTACPEQMLGKENSGANWRIGCWRSRPRLAGRRRRSLNRPRAISSRLQRDWTTRVALASSRQRPLGPECWPTSWPPDTTSTPAPGWSRAVRANWSWSSSTGCDAGSATRRAPAGC